MKLSIIFTLSLLISVLVYPIFATHNPLSHVAVFIQTKRCLSNPQDISELCEILRTKRLDCYLTRDNSDECIKAKEV